MAREFFRYDDNSSMEIENLASRAEETARVAILAALLPAPGAKRSSESVAK